MKVKERKKTMVDRELIGFWLTDMIDREYGEVEGCIENERLWLHGATTDEARNCIEGNIETDMEYLRVLEELKETINNRF